MSNINDGFNDYYNEFKDWTKKQILLRTFDICLENADKDREIERLNNIIDELEEELEREIEFGKRIPKEADNYNSSLVRHTLEIVLERLRKLKEGNKEW